MSERKMITLVCDGCGKESKNTVHNNGGEWMAVKVLPRAPMMQAVLGHEFIAIDLCDECGVAVRRAFSRSRASVVAGEE